MVLMQVHGSCGPCRGNSVAVAAVGFYPALSDDVGLTCATPSHAALPVWVGGSILPCLHIEGEVSLIALPDSTSFGSLWASVLPKITSFEYDGQHWGLCLIL